MPRKKRRKGPIKHNKFEKTPAGLETIKAWKRRVSFLEKKYNSLLALVRSKEVVYGRFAYIKPPAKNNNPDNIYNIEGIYFLYNESEVVYVGYSSCITTRIGTHIREGIKSFTHYDVLVLDNVTTEEYLEKEKDFISSHKPKYNIAHN